MKDKRYNRRHTGDRRDLLARCMFWSVARKEGEPDYDCQSRKTEARSGLPAHEIPDWLADADWMTEAQKKAKEVREATEKGQEKWIADLTAKMRLRDPTWTWSYGTSVQWSNAVPPPPADEPPAEAAPPENLGPPPREPPPPLPASARGSVGSSPDD